VLLQAKRILHHMMQKEISFKINLIITAILQGQMT